ncbi:MAG: transglutaminase-like domain-containing protein [Elusimicrobia bacterium]|nr:transglutaminase-like domain-containing protein [Elusimicrobiota bacterium]
MAAKKLTEPELRGLASLIDEEDRASLELIEGRVMEAGPAILPFLDELRAKADPVLRERAEALARRVRFADLRASFATLTVRGEADLERGAWLIARFGYPDLNSSSHAAWLNELAGRIKAGLAPGADTPAVFARLNSQLFDALGFCGNEKRYYDPDNSYLNRVIETRRGIPVSLSVLYILLARRLDLPVFGVATPGHFLVGLRLGQTVNFLDPYSRGRMMNLAEVQRMLSRNGYAFRSEFVAPAPARDILARMMRNLVSIYQKAGQAERTEMLSGLVDILLKGKPAPA